MTDIEAIAAKLTKAMKPALLALDGEFRSAASCKGTTPQAVQALFRRCPEILDREFQDGCAMRFYYRLNATGFAVRAALGETQ
jgi:hypothetical protein